MKAETEGSLGAPHQGAAEPLCCALLRHHLLLALPASGQPEVLCQPVLKAAVRVMGESGSDSESYRCLEVCRERKRTKDGKGLRNEWEVNTGVLLRTCRLHTSPLLPPLLHLIKLLRQ